MPRQFNLYQQSNMNSYHMSSSSSSSSSKIKESPTKLDRILYLNSPSQNQSTIDNHSMNNTTYNNNNLNISSIDNTYQTTNIQPRITLSQYYHTTQKQYPYYNQSITSMNKLSGNNNHTTSNTTNNNTTTITTPMTIHQPNTNQTLKHITTSQEISSSSSSSTNYAPPLPPPPLPHHHNHHSHHQQQQHQHHPIQHPNTFISGTNEFQHPMIPERSHSINPISSSTTQPLMSNYLHDTRRYMTGNSIFEQRPNPQHQFQPTQQTHQSNSHIIKTGISYSNDTNVICSTVNQSVPMGLPPPPPPSFTQYTQIHNHPSNINIQQYTPIIQPFVPPISYRPAAQAPNSNFMPISHCNYSNVTNIAPTVAMTTTTITTTTISTINGITTTTTTVNKNNAVINRRVRIQESSSQAQNLSNHQSMHSIQQMNTTTKTRQEMNVTTTTTATATSSGGAPNNLTYKHLPNMSSQTQNVKEITNPSSETIHSNHFPYQSETFNSIQPTGIYTTVSTSSGITSVTIANTTLTINRTEQQSSTPINNNPSISSSSYHRSLSKKPTDNTEQRRKARELYVALKQRYPSTNHNNSVNPSHRHQHQHQNHHHINADDDDHLSQTQTSDIKTLIKTNQNNETINVLEEHIDCSESNYARRMHERLQEGMREAQESLWMPDLPELNKMNRLSSSSSMNNNGNNSSSITQLSDGITNLRLYWCNKLHNNQPMINNYNLQSIHNNEYSNMDIKYGVCSDVEDLLNQHERRLMSTSGNDSDKNVNELTKFNSASDTEEFLSNDYRIQASIRAMNYGHMGCDPIQPSSYNWLRKVNNNETVGDGLHNRYFIPPRLCNLDSSINQSDGFVSTSGISQQQSLLTRARRRQIDGRSLSSSIAKHDDAERIYGIVPLSPSYLYNQFMPSTGLMIKGMMSNSSSSSTRTNQDNEIHFPGTISAPPGTPIKLPYAAPASLIGTTSGFSCPESGSQIINGLGVNGSRLSLTSNGSCVSTVEEKQAEEIQKLKRKLEQAEKKVSELTTQLTTNAHVVSAFEQSLNNMSQRLQNLSNTTTRKDSELHELRATIDALRNQTELGFFKKPPINRPCELNKSFTKDLLKQQENSCISTTTTTTTITISNTSNHSENEQAYMNSRLTISNASLNDIDNQQLQMDNSVDRVVSTTSGCKSSGSNVKKNGWFRNSLGKAFRKKTTSSSTLSIHSQSDLDCPTSSIQHKSIYHSNTTNTNNSLPPGHPSNLPQSPTMDHKGLHNTTTTTTTTINQSHVNSIQSNNHMNVLPILSNTHLNGLSPSNSSSLSSSSSSWSTLGIGGNGQNNCNIITATTTTSSSNSSTIIPQTNEQTDRLNNARQQQQQQQHQQDHRPIHSNQLSCPNHLINYNKSDKQNTSFNVEERDKNMLDNNDSKLELTKQSCQDELNHLKCQLAEKESKLTDVQLEALASAHQLDQLKDEMSHLYSQLNYLRTDNERLQILVKHLQKQQQYHHHQQQHQLQHNTTNSSISSRLLLMNNDNVMTSTNTTMTLTPTNKDVHCNSLTQTIPSMSLQHKSTGLHNDDNNDISMVFNTEIVPVECVTCSGELILKEVLLCLLYFVPTN
ncbi:hypothetical protein Smp_164630 [Schistosoma mansoni]|uniref:hypothetical protein n=1 Tax=Schistosoma mansoni TaxID=6183 RepID=UPI00022DC109|nr:hypothetical protein Smp_164630 [Schistosoma mansoni]|eukprot:XP_018652802.1 hypothetical protein Smp_164630 [Schistosoma mansoni]